MIHISFHAISCEIWGKYSIPPLVPVYKPFHCDCIALQQCHCLVVVLPQISDQILSHVSFRAHFL